MSQPTTQVADSTVGGTVRTNLGWFRRHLKAGNKAESTIETYRRPSSN